MENLAKLVQFGNSKLPNTTVIFNLGPAKGCPAAALGLCEYRKNCKHQDSKKDSCYAIRPENFRPNVLQYRRRQAQYWAKVTPEQFASEFIAMYNRKRNKPDLIRFNEAGDFYGQECVKKVYKIARLIYQATGVRTYLYTHRSDLKFYSYIGRVQGQDNKLPYINIIGSGLQFFSGLKLHFVGVTRAEYEHYKEEETRRPWYRTGKGPNHARYFCPGDCKKCTICSTEQQGTIYTVIH